MDDALPPAMAPEPGSYDHVDPDAERQRKAEASLREQRLREVEASILSTPTGREWLWGVLNTFGALEAKIAVTGSEYENGYWNGHRDAGLRLLQTFIRHSPADFSRMFAENQDRA
jgi:hypothetical protein